MGEKINCENAEFFIHRYVTGEISERENEKLKTHLGTCSACRESVAELQALEYLLGELGDIEKEPPPFLTGRIASNLPSRIVPGWLSWRALHPYVAALSLILALAIGFFSRDILLKPDPSQLSVQTVRIIFYSPEASSVALVGDFNEWGQREVTLAHSKDQGVWEFSLALKPGVYHYNLLVDGQRWASNPKSSSLVPDGYGGYDSVLVVSEKCQEDCT